MIKNQNFEEYKNIVESVFNPFYGLDELDNQKLNEKAMDGLLNRASPYMLRNDGTLLECDRIHPYIKYNGWNGNKDEIEYLFNDNLNYLNHIFETLSLNEKYLFEATWKNQNNLIRHYDEHVLKEGEKFNPDNPKFASNMTLEDYKNEAEKLSETSAEKSVYQIYTCTPENSDEEIKRRAVNFKANITGWVLEPQLGREGRMPRKIKVSKYINPKFFPPEVRGTGYYRAAVIYVDEPTEDNIMSYFIIKDSKFKNLFNHQWLSELPENQEE